jgi:hypothetical protein
MMGFAHRSARPAAGPVGMSVIAVSQTRYSTRRDLEPVFATTTGWGLAAMCTAAPAKPYAPTAPDQSRSSESSVWTMPTLPGTICVSATQAGLGICVGFTWAAVIACAMAAALDHTTATAWLVSKTRIAMKLVSVHVTQAGVGTRATCGEGSVLRFARDVTGQTRPTATAVWRMRILIMTAGTVSARRTGLGLAVSCGQVTVIPTVVDAMAQRALTVSGASLMATSASQGSVSARTSGAGHPERSTKARVAHSA